MPFAPGKSGNPAGRAKGQRTVGNVQSDIRRSSIRILGEHAPELIELGVARALAGNAEALGGCLHLLAAMAGQQQETKQSGTTAQATNSHQVKHGAEA